MAAAGGPSSVAGPPSNGAKDAAVAVAVQVCQPGVVPATRLASPYVVPP
jgi:hypothetical protein